MSSSQVPTCPPSQLYRGLSLGCKRLEVVADHSTPSSAEVKNEWSYKPTPRIYHHNVHMDSCNIPPLL
jgi:2,3-bisphosphoglycerate-independent phosphoglycerate mutase